MAFQTAYHMDDSDADDEYERSVITSPVVPTDDENSPIDSDPASAEHTPTFGRTDKQNLSPGISILEWTTGQTADYLSTLGLHQYRDKFIGWKCEQPFQEVADMLQKMKLWVKR